MLHVTDGPHDVHGRDARREAMANGDRPLPGVRFHISAEKAETKAQAEQRRAQLASETRASRMCWR